ncbi:MAG TPA: GNAT family N-acetyltransferase [Actinomycetota bacterium]|jgi:CelD/BcsL family acetyltransferase involved in cellulose biosynthesis
MDVRRTTGPEAFDLPEWAGLAARDPTRHVFLLPEWGRAWWEEFGAGQELIVLTFLDPEPVGLAALTLDTEPGPSPASRTPGGGGRLRFLGGDDLTDYMGPATAGPEYLPGVADALVRYACDEIPGWSLFDAKCLPVPFGFAEWLVEAADRLGVRFELEQHETTAVLPLPRSFEEYLDSLAAKDRHEVRRKLRRFEREAPDARLVTATEDSLERDLRDFVGMHRASGGPKGHFMGPERETFFLRIARSFQPRGLLSLDFLETGETAGRRIAATFSFRHEGTFYLYNSAYDASMRAISPGLTIVVRLIERSIAEGYRRLDFLRGEERYKYDLGAVALPLHAVRLRRSPEVPGALGSRPANARA